MEAGTGTPAPRRRPAGSTQDELKGTAYELFVLLVSVLSITNTVIAVLPFASPVQQVALVSDTMAIPVFLLDFLVRFRTAHSRRQYVLRQFGWADLLSAVPTLGILRVFRVVRTIRLLRIRGRDQVLVDLDRDRASATFLLTLFLVMLVVEFAGMAIYAIEAPAAGSNIRSPSDAIWWGFVTVTTVGYGDRYPVTGAGRVVGTLLLFVGIGLFAVLTGFIANAFLAPRASSRLRHVPGDSLEADVVELRKMLIEQEERATAIRRKLDDIERRARHRVREAAPAATPDGAREPAPDGAQDAAPVVVRDRPAGGPDQSPGGDPGST